MVRVHLGILTNKLYRHGEGKLDIYMNAISLVAAITATICLIFDALDYAIYLMCLAAYLKE